MPRSTSKFDFTVHSKPRSEIAGHLARRVFQGWCAASGRARRKGLRRFVNENAKIRIAGSAGYDIAGLVQGMVN